MNKVRAWYHQRMAALWQRVEDWLDRLAFPAPRWYRRAEQRLSWWVHDRKEYHQGMWVALLPCEYCVGKGWAWAQRVRGGYGKAVKIDCPICSGYRGAA